MRDCRWLNRPPKKLGGGRQGFDLCFGVNCNDGKYNREEGNYGKLMRIFDDDLKQYLPPQVSNTSYTYTRYFQFRTETICLGFRTIVARLAHAFRERKKAIEPLDPLPWPKNKLPVEHLAERSGTEKLLIVGSEEMPDKGTCAAALARHRATRGLFLNEKFNWKVCDSDGNPITNAKGKKPAGAEEWVSHA